MPQNRIPLEPGQMYHIWTHANGDDNLFREGQNYTYFLEKYSYQIEPVAETFAYCLMPNHLHVMVRVKGEEGVLEFMRAGDLIQPSKGSKPLEGSATSSVVNFLIFLMDILKPSTNSTIEKAACLFPISNANLSIPTTISEP